MAKLTESELLELKELALKKKELLECLYDITSRKKFLGEESEVDQFIEYLDFREPYYEQLAELDKQAGGKLKEFKPDFSNENRLYREISQITTNAKDISLQIVELDKKNNENMGRLHKKLMSEIRSISANKKARNSYNFFQVQSDGDFGRK